MADGIRPCAELVDEVLAIGRRAADAILEIYRDPAAFDVQSKADASPLTQADLAANAVIEAGLKALSPGIPILTEESLMAPFAVRKRWQRYWLVDPLDGTKEFIRRSDQFTINIALIEGHQARLGLVYVPVTGVAYVGIAGDAAYRCEQGRRQKIFCRPLGTARRALEVVASTHHRSAATETFIALLKTEFGAIRSRSIGSSLKFCLLAEGVADVYPRLAPTCEWDTAAAQAVLQAAGGAVYQYDLSELRYNTKDNIVNPYFYAVADPAYDWRALITKSQAADDVLM